MDEKLIDQVIEQIQLDVRDGDVSAIDELLKLVLNGQNKKYFIGYLSEDRIEELGYDLTKLYTDDTEWTKRQNLSKC